MATWFARQSTNINAANVWNSAANGSGSWLTWPAASGDVLMANSFTITVNISTNLGATGEIRNDTTGPATAGGRFALDAGVTLIANVYAGGTAVTQGCVGLLDGDATVIGDVYAGTGCHGARNSPTGTGLLTIIGTAYGNDYGPGSTGITAGIYGAVNASTTTGALRVYRTVMGARGMPAVSGPFTYINPRAAQQSVRATAGLTEVILRDVVGWTPDSSDALIGTSYEGLTGIMVPVPQRQSLIAMAMSGAPFVNDVHIPESFSSGFSDAFA
jgi:hypothetical protein